MLALPETPSSRLADLYDALHSFRVCLVEKQIKSAISHAQRIQLHGYRVQYWSGKEWSVAASTTTPSTLFTEPKPLPPSRAEYIILKAIGETRRGLPTLTGYTGYYSENNLLYAKTIGKNLAKLWRIYNYIKEQKGKL
jgi:hypothetical protein